MIKLITMRVIHPVELVYEEDGEKKICRANLDFAECKLLNTGLPDDTTLILESKLKEHFLKNNYL